MHLTSAPALTGISAVMLPLGLFVLALLRGPVSPPSSVLNFADSEKVWRSVRPVRMRGMAARDGAPLYFRHCPGGRGKGVAIIIHGSSANSIALTPLGRALSDQGIAAYFPDLRGHGQSKPEGDVSYIGQLEDDLADLVSLVGTENPGEPIILIGHSAGGAFALRVAGGREGELFAGFIALSPFLGWAAPTSKRGNGSWTSRSTSRLCAIHMLRQLGMTWADGARVLAFAAPAQHKSEMTRYYSYRLTENFGLGRRWSQAIARINKPSIVLVGQDDELFVAGKYEETMFSLSSSLKVRLLPGVDHLGISTQSEAFVEIIRCAQDLVANAERSAPRRRQTPALREGLAPYS